MKPTLKKVKLNEVVFNRDIYPRADTNPSKIQEYHQNLEMIEAAENFISVAADMELLDGRHRHLAYLKREEETGCTGETEINVFVYQVAGLLEKLAVSAKLNSSHGQQLSMSDKKSTAKKLFRAGFEEKSLPEYLAVGERTVRDWLSRDKKEMKEERNEKILSMWMACHTQQEIADAVGVDFRTVSLILADLPKMEKPSHTYQDGFKPPIYNVWKQQNKTNEVNHFGNSEVSFVDNLLYLYTQPGDIVVDPFAGGGSTIDICKKRGRRYFVSDRKPIFERRHEIRQHDITNGLLKPPSWKDVSLVYLDPPYWKQAEGRYSNDDTDLANMPLDEFNRWLSSIIKDYASKLSTGSKIALIIQPTQWKAEGRQFVDHVSDMCKMVDLKINMRIQAPYESQQCTAQMVEWAKENREVLVLSREIIIWEV